MENIKFQLNEENGNFYYLSNNCSVKCEEKNVHKAYRVVCNKCSDKYKICSKCCEAKQLMKEPYTIIIIRIFREKEGVDYKLL